MASAADTISADIRKRFGGDIGDDLVAECVKVCQANNMTGEDLFYKWEATRYNRGPAPQLTLKDIHDVRAQIQRDVRMRNNVAKRFTRGSLSGPQSRGFAMSSRGVRSNLGGSTGTPVKPAVRPQDGFDTSRLEKNVSIAGPSRSRVTIVGPPTDEAARQKRSYHYMYEKVSERSELLDDRIDHFGELVKDYYNVEELGDPAAVAEEDVVVVGRVVLDAESSSGSVKLNEASLMFESSRMMGSGSRIPLRFDPDVKVRKGKPGLGGQGFFPGAIVGLKGKNGGGGSFLVTEILSLPPLEPPSPTLIKAEAGETQFSMHIACGPFTHDGDLQFRHFQSLVAKLKLMATKPAVVLLIGPFIDASHPSIKIGDVDSPPEEMFRTVFRNRLTEFLDSSPGSRVLLVPSTRDILSNHTVFPQPELDRTLCSDSRIHMLPNPARFTLNGVHFAASSVDVLFHLRKEEFFKHATEVEPLPGPADPEGQTPSDAMANLCRHVLQQRSFYPIFPVPLDLTHELSVDVTHSDLLYFTPQDDDSEASGSAEDPTAARCAPDVLIVPSRLKHFSKVVDHTVAVNPSFLTKSTYAVLEYAGHTVPGPAKDRLKVEIERVEV
ncbi:DNA polymerase alpha, subunit B [Ganoderma leucocontextum]|nr:DNA polymerase alpha, subunit B [Ganoderma leucocontextum]